MKVLDPLLVAHIGDVGTTVTIQTVLDWGLSGNAGIRIYTVTATAALSVVSSQATWSISLLADPDQVGLSLDTGNVWELKSAFIFNMVIAATHNSDIGKGPNGVTKTVDYQGGYDTLSNLVGQFAEFTGTSTLVAALDILYRRLELTDDERTALLASRNR